MTELIRGIFKGLLLFLPSICFIQIAYWSGNPTDESWLTAFRISGLIAIPHLIAYWHLSDRHDPIVSGCDLYLVLMSLLVWTRMTDWVLFLGDYLRASFLWVCILLSIAVASIPIVRAKLKIHLPDYVKLRIYIIVIGLATVISFPVRYEPLLAVAIPATLITLAFNKFNFEKSSASRSEVGK